MKFFSSIVLLIFLSACASTRMSDSGIQSSFKDKKFEEAYEKLKIGLEKERGKNDELLYLLDLGIVLQAQERFEESTEYFLQAEKIAEIQDYTDFAKESAGLLTSQNQVQYKGEDFEKILINAYLALNFSLESNYEGALVEARKVDSLIYRLVTKAGKNYQPSVFARYLSGVLYEAIGDFDNAYIAYKKTHELKPGFSELGLDLFRLSFKARRTEDSHKWIQEYGLTEDQQEIEKQKAFKSKKMGELVVVFQNGWGPQKRPHPNYRRIPKFYPRANPVQSAQISLNGEVKGKTFLLEDIEKNALYNLDEKYKSMIAKSIAGIIAKESAAEVVARTTQNESLGALTSVLLHASDQADLRSWVLLPKEIQMARFSLPPGEYEIDVTPEGYGGGFQSLEKRKIKVEAGKTVFTGFRYF